MVDMLDITVVKGYFRLALQYPIPLKKKLILLIIYIAYSITYIYKFTLNIYK